MVFLKRTKGLTAALLPPTQICQTETTCVKNSCANVPHKRPKQQNVDGESVQLKRTKPSMKSAGQIFSANVLSNSSNLNELITTFLKTTEDWSAEKLYTIYSGCFDYELVIPDVDLVQSLKVLTADLLPPTQIFQIETTCTNVPHKHPKQQNVDGKSVQLKRTKPSMKSTEQISSASFFSNSSNLNELITTFLKTTEDFSAEKFYTIYSACFDHELVIPDVDLVQNPKSAVSEEKRNESNHKSQDNDGNRIKDCAHTTSTPNKLTDATVSDIMETIISNSLMMSKENFLSEYSNALYKCDSSEYSASELDSTINSDFDYVQDILNEIDGLDASSLYKRHLSSSNSSGSHLSTINLAESDEDGNNCQESVNWDKENKRVKKRNEKAETQNTAIAEKIMLSDNISSPNGICGPSNNSTDKRKEAIHPNDESCGIWVECVLCLKWRYLEGVKDPSEVDSAWNCAQLPKYAAMQEDEVIKLACDEAEDVTGTDQTQYIYGEYGTGSIVLAKMPGYPEWPSMIDCDSEGRFAEFCPITGDIKRYRVVFLDPGQPSTQLLPASCIRRFCEVSQIKLEKRYAKYRRRLEAAIAEAQRAIDLPVEERVFKYGYPYSNGRPNRFL